MKKSGWILLPAAFFLLINFSISSVKLLFFTRLIYFLFLISLFFFLRRFDISKILKAVVGGISIVVFSYGILQKFVLFPIYLERFKPGDNFYSLAVISRIQSGRIFSIFRLPTLYAIICAVLILFLFHYMLRAPLLKYKVLWGLLLLPGLFNLVLTQSFGGIIYLTAGLLAYLLLSGILKLKYLAPVLMTLVLFLSITIALRFQEARKLEPVKLRFSNWVQAVRAFSAGPFWGVGLGNYESSVSFFTHHDEARSIYAHNFFLQFTAETGIIIPLFLLLLLFLSRKKLKPRVKNDNETVLHISIFLILLTYNLIDIGFYFFPAGLAGVIALSRIYPSENREFKLNLVVLVLLAALLSLNALSENYRGEGDLLMNQGYAADAEINYKKSITVNPFNFKTLMAYSKLELSRNDLEKAEKKLARSLDIYPDSSFSHFLMSEIQLKKGHLVQAFFHAAHAHQKNIIDSTCQNWYLEIKKHLEARQQKTQEIK